MLSGGYEDDEDLGDLVIYTGHGGQDPRTKAQVAHQEFHTGNKGLAISCDRGYPVRVVRGTDLDSPFAAEEGYRYDGLYSVEKYWSQAGKSGFRVWRFRLAKIGEDKPPIRPGKQAPVGRESPSRTHTTVIRTIRDTEIERWVKELYDYRCQVCGLAVSTPSGPYAEAAHVRPLGRPHRGPDVAGNVLCLCPNHHVQFDKGALALTDELDLLGFDGEFRVDPQHGIDLDYVRYHRESLYLSGKS